MSKKLGCFLVAMIALLVLMYFSVKSMSNLSPELILLNDTGLEIERAQVILPSSRVTFPSLKAGQRVTRYYQLEQQDGQYEYFVEFSNDELVEGSCGYITAHEAGKRMLLHVQGPDKVQCVLSSKL